MHFSLHIPTRDGLITLGRTIALLDGGQLKIILERDSKAGKSLLALAVDSALYPARYPNGITEDMRADDMLGPTGNVRPPFSAFINLMPVVPLEPIEKNMRLALFMRLNSSARVLLISNLRLAANEIGAHNPIAISPDIEMDFKILPGEFVRQIDLTVPDEKLRARLAERLGTETEIAGGLPRPGPNRAPPSGWDI